MSEDLLLSSEILLRIVKGEEREFDVLGIHDADFIALHDEENFTGVAFWCDGEIQIVLGMSIFAIIVERSDWFSKFCTGYEIKSFWPSYDRESMEHDGLWKLSLMPITDDEEESES